MAKKKEKKLDWVLIAESDDKKHVDNLIRVYKEDKRAARILYHQEKTKFTYYRLVKFTKNKKDFSYVEYKVTYGISVTGIMYHRATRVNCIIAKGSKFWYVNNIHRNSTIRPLCMYHFSDFGMGYYGNNSKHFSDFGMGYYGNNSKQQFRKMIIDEFSDIFFWFKLIYEKEDMHYTAFNTIVRKKLFRHNEFLKDKYGVVLPIAKLVNESFSIRNYNTRDFIKIWKEMKKVLSNVDSLTVELFTDPLFKDTCKMAAAMGEKVNCKWGSKRLKAEHDKWSKIITKTVADCEPLQILQIKEVYKAFAEYSGYKLLETNREMLAEGMYQNHCVGTYISDVDNGRTAIFHVEGYTLQVSINTQYTPTLTLGNEVSDVNEKYGTRHILKRMQFRGRHNADAPQKLVDKVDQIIEEFNISEVAKYTGNKKTLEEYMVVDEPGMRFAFDDRLPF